MKTPRSPCRRSHSRPRFLLTCLALCGALMPTLLVGQCRVSGSAPVEDLRLAEAACERVDHRFPLLFGTPAPGGTIEVSDTVLFFAVERTTPDWKMIWPTSARMREYFGEAGLDEADLSTQIDLQWSTVLPHEVAHLLLIAEVDRRRPPNAARQRLPDWLHEGTGVWMEPPAHRQDEYATLRVLQPFIPSVDELTRMSISGAVDDVEGGSTIMRTFYPCASEEACGGRPHWSRSFTVTTRQFPDGRVVEDTVFHDAPPPAPSPTGSHFYAYSALLVRYIHHRGGVSAMGALLDRLAADPGVEQPLVGLPGLPSSRTALQEDWNAWFRRWIFEEAPSARRDAELRLLAEDAQIRDAEITYPETTDGSPVRGRLHAVARFVRSSAAAVEERWMRELHPLSAAGSGGRGRNGDREEELPAIIALHCMRHSGW